MSKTLTRMSHITGVTPDQYNTGFVYMKFWNIWDKNEETLKEVFASQLKMITPQTRAIKVNDLLTGEVTYL